MDNRCTVDTTIVGANPCIRPCCWGALNAIPTMVDMVKQKETNAMKIYLKGKNRAGSQKFWFLWPGKKRPWKGVCFLIGLEKFKKGGLSPRARGYGFSQKGKPGKTAILQRLFNIVFHQNDKVVPFYYEVGETSQWAVEFCKDFFLSFIYQYIAFRSRNTEYLSRNIRRDFDIAREIATNEKFDFLVSWIDGVEKLVMDESLKVMDNCT